MVTLRLRSMVWFATGIALALLATLLVTQAWRVDAAPGDTDSTFVPVTPCRLFDTRPGELPDTGQKTPIAAGDGNGLVQQVTGDVGNCVGIPADATAVALNVTIVNPTAQSNLRVFPADAGAPLVSNLNWLAGQSATPNKVDVKLSGDGKVKLVNFNGSVDVIGDVVGYYINSTLKELAAGLVAVNAELVAVNDELDAVNNELVAVNDELDVVDDRTAVLEASEPFAVSNYDSGPLINLIGPAESVLDVSVTAPVDGQVTVYYSTYVQNTVTEGDTVCAPYLSTDIPATILATAEGVGFWETAAAGDGDQGSVSGTATFDVAAGPTVTYSLACEQQDGNGAVGGPTMTAIFTPNA